jgi:serine/threonine protein kinase
LLPAAAVVVPAGGAFRGAHPVPAAPLVAPAASAPQVSIARDEALQGHVSEHIKALQGELAMLQKLKHENIVQYLGTDRTPDSMYIFLEYVHGGSIASLLAKFGPFQEAVIRVYTRQILRGLEYLHAGGHVHRDIKVRRMCARVLCACVHVSAEGRQMGPQGGLGQQGK